MNTRNELSALSASIVDAAIGLHRAFGSGLMERVYEAALAGELSICGIMSRRQVAVPVVYQGEAPDEEAYRIGLLVDESIVVEPKAGIKRHVIDSPQSISAYSSAFLASPCSASL